MYMYILIQFDILKCRYSHRHTIDGVHKNEFRKYGVYPQYSDSKNDKVL